MTRSAEGNIISLVGKSLRKWYRGRSRPDNASKSTFLRYQTESNSLFRIALLQLSNIAANTPIIASKAATRKFGEMGSSQYICVLVGYQHKPLYCTIKWIKTKLQAEGYGCHTCLHIHHYTLLTSWLYPKEMRKYQKFEYECQNVLREKFSCWLCDENEQIRNQNKHKLETPVLCCISA